MRSPAEPASSLEFSAALYSVGADRRELHLDAGVLGFEGRDDLVLPDGKIVVAPAFDGQRHVFGKGRGGDGAKRRGSEEGFHEFRRHSAFSTVGYAALFARSNFRKGRAQHVPGPFQKGFGLQPASGAAGE